MTPYQELQAIRRKLEKLEKLYCCIQEGDSEFENSPAATITDEMINTWNSASGGTTFNAGTQDFEGDGSTVMFQIAHGLTVPVGYTIQGFATRADDVTGGLFQTTTDDTFINITFIGSAPTGPILLNWFAVIVPE